MAGRLNMADPLSLSEIATLPVPKVFAVLLVCALNAENVAPLATSPISRAETIVTMPLRRSRPVVSRCLMAL